VPGLNQGSRPMTRLWIVTGVAAILLGPLPARLPAQGEDESLDARVQRAIDRGVDYLREQQIKGGKRDGAWRGPLAPFQGGVSSLCTLAMLNAGVPPNDPDIKRALNYLRTVKPEKTYVVALQTLVFCAADPEKDKRLIRRNAEWLFWKQLEDGSWAYPDGPGDNSISHLALAALDAAERAGVEVRTSAWRSALAYWEEVQAPRGYWGYSKAARVTATGSMTCAGIASMVLAGDRVHPADGAAVGKRIVCCKRTAADEHEAALGRAMSWLAANFTVRSNPNQTQWTLYYLYGLERVGGLTGRHFIGQHDWYREGCEYLVGDQDQLSGFWKAPGFAENEPLIATPLALLFLTKGGRPVLVAKAAVGPEESWNHHRHDVRNLVRHAETKWKRDLGWEVLDLDLARTENLASVPVLYLAGRTDPLPEAEDARRKLAEKLREYLDGGGFILAEGNCDRADFDAGFRKLVALMFPEPEHPLKPLPPEHPIYHGEQKVAPDLQPPLLGVEVKGRTRLVYLPPNESKRLDEPLSCLWELADRRRMREYSEDVAQKVEAGLALGVNILDYATNRKLKGPISRP